MIIGYEAKRIFHNATGLGNYSRDIIKILSQFHPEHSYKLYNPKPGKFTIPNAGKSVVEQLPRSKKDKFFKNYWRRKGVVKDLVEDKIDIYHGLSGEIPLNLKENKIKSVVTIHDLIFLRYPQFYSFLDRYIYKKKFLHAARNADVIIAVSEQTKSDIVEFLEVPSSKIKVIYQGCQKEYKTLYDKETIQQVLEKYKVPENFILNVGTVESRKNVLAAVKAIKNVATHLVIVGSLTAYGKKVKEYIEKEQLQEKVIFLSGLNTKELAALYQGAKVFIYPSLFEGFGIPIIEALYSKTPVITTNYGCFPEAGGPNSIYISPENITQISREINVLLANEAERLSIAEKGFEYVQKFNDENIAVQLNEVYSGLLAVKS